MYDFEGRRRPVVFSACEDPKEESKNLLAVVKTTFTDLICTENDRFLQVDSKKDGLIDLVNVHVSTDEKVFLRFWVPADRSKDQVGCYLLQTRHHFGCSYGFCSVNILR